MNKSIYFYWGNETMSYMRYMTLYSFCLFNPEWQVYLIKNSTLSERPVRWVTAEKQDKTEYSGPDYFGLLSELNIEIIEFKTSMLDLDKEIVNNMSDVHIKDILNWKILSSWGGVVADMDILFVKPLFDEIDAFTEIGLVCFDGYPKKDYIPVTFMYSSGENVFFEKVYRNALKNYKPSVYESCGTLCIKEENLQEVIKNFSNLKIQRLKDEIVFPFIDYSWEETIEMLYDSDNTHLMRPTSIGIHWYGGTSLSQYYNNLLNEQTIYEIDNTISIIIRRIL